MQRNTAFHISNLLLAVTAFRNVHVEGARLGATATANSNVRSTALLQEQESAGAFLDGEEEATAHIRARFQVHYRVRGHASSNGLPMMDLPAAVGAKYDAPKELDQGNFGEVWKATEKSTNKSVILKMFYGIDSFTGKKFHLTWNRAMADRMLSLDLEAAIEECRVAKLFEEQASSNKKYATRVMHCYEDQASRGKEFSNEALYLVNEDCAGDGGKNLLYWINEQKDALAKPHPKIYLHKVRRLYKQMIEGISFMHTAGFVHHDIKPENIMIKMKDGEEYVKIVDFGGIMSTKDSSCNRTDLVASVLYAPPEWFDREGAYPGFDCTNPSSFDIYAIGLVLDEMLTGISYYSKLRAYHTDLPSEEMILECMARGRELPYCQQKAFDQQIKRRGGGEWNMTSGFTDPDVSMDSNVAKLQAWLMERRVVRTALKPSVKVYQRFAKKVDWYTTYTLMLAFNATDRPSPDAVLKSQFLSDVSSYSDPDVCPICKKEEMLARRNSRKHSSRGSRDVQKPEDSEATDDEDLEGPEGTTIEDESPDMTKGRGRASAVRKKQSFAPKPGKVSWSANKKKDEKHREDKKDETNKEDKKDEKKKKVRKSKDNSKKKHKSHGSRGSAAHKPRGTKSPAAEVKESKRASVAHKSSIGERGSGKHSSAKRSSRGSEKRNSHVTEASKEKSS